MPCTLTIRRSVLLGETGCKIYSFVRLHKEKSIHCKIYIKSIPLSMNTKIYMLLLRYLKFLTVLLSVILH